MSKVYQPVVIENTEKFIQALEESYFFVDYDIEDKTFAKSYLLDVFTNKFIDGKLDDDEGIFNESEFETILKEIAAGSLLHQLKEKGLVNSYEDDQTEETFFLTEKGKQYLRDNNNNLF